MEAASAAGKQALSLAATSDRISVGGARGVRPGDVLDDEETEELRRHRQRRRRDDQPAGKNRDDRLAEFLVKGVKLEDGAGPP